MIEKMEPGYLSLLPVVVVFVMAFATKKVLWALFSGIIVGVAILTFGEGTLSVEIKCVTDVLSNDWSLKSILFCFFIGAFVFVLEASGGVEGLVNYLTIRKRWVTSGLSAQLLAYIIGLLLFIDGVSSIVVAGVAGRPLFDKLHVPRHRLAYIIDSTASPVAWLFPVNAAGAFLMVMISGQISAGLIQDEPFACLLSVIPFQIYGIASLLTVGLSIFFGREMGVMKRDRSGLNIVNQKSIGYKTDLSSEGKTQAASMVIPLMLLAAFNFIVLFITGNGDIFKGDGSTALVVSVVITLLVTGLYYQSRRIVAFKKYLTWCLKGASGFFEIVIILALAFIMSNVINELGTGAYIATLCGGVDVTLLPVIVFLVGVLISFTTGTSGGTVAILIPITIPLAANLDAHIPLILGAIISSAVFGDHCSPISDSTILSSMMAEIPVMEHVKTQMPYALFCGTLSAMSFLVLGFWM
ncbi:sodium:proton antiporter [Marinilabiliaceae bacterium JC017]|nr:sodium:proton antiporter [Marinilabiliaceae bacterium JC017]